MSANPYPESTWGKKVVDVVINLNERRGSSIKDIKENLIKNRYSARFIENAVRQAVKEGVLSQTKTKPFKYKLVVQRKSTNSKTPLTPQEILKTSTFIEGSFAWIGDIYSSRMDNFNFFFVFATSKGCFLVSHGSDQRFQCEGGGGNIVIPDNPGFSDPDSGQAFADAETGLQPKWLSDQLMPYKSKVSSDPIAFVNDNYSSIDLQLFGRQPLRELLKNISQSWAWGLHWEGLCRLPKIAFPTSSDRFLLNLLVCLDFNEQSMVYDVNGLLSRDVEDDDIKTVGDIAFRHNKMEASDFPGHETRSKKESKKLIKKAEKDAEVTWYEFVETFVYKY